MKKQFGFDGEDEKKPKCPGEIACGKFQIALSECGNGFEACLPSDGGKPCELLSSKPKSSEQANDEPELDSFDLFISRILWLRGEQITGGLDLGEILQSEYDALVLFNFKYEQYAQQSDLVQRKYLERILEWQPAVAGVRAMKR